MSTNKEERKHVFQIEPDGCVMPVALTRGSAVSELPTGVYSLNYHPEKGFYLRPENEYKLPSKVYGDSPAHVDRFLRSYELNDKNLGVLLVGDAGSGKTLTLKTLVQKGIENQIPTILINSAYSGQALTQFLSTITQNCIVAFDEYDKTYGGNKGTEDEAQTTLLQLLDGTSACSKKLFIFTANEENRISQYMKDRPSRIRYTLRFKRIALKTVVQYVSANLKEFKEEHLRAFVHMALSDGVDQKATSGPAASSDGMNFDSMRELICEMNQFKGTLNDSLALMMGNGATSYSCFDVDIYKGDVKLAVGSATGAHDGAYLSVDDYSIKVNYAEKELKPSVMNEDVVVLPEREELVGKIITLTKDDFSQFGMEVDVVEFEKDGLRYVCRYATHEEYHHTTSKISSDISMSNSGKLPPYSVLRNPMASRQFEPALTLLNNEGRRIY